MTVVSRRQFLKLSGAMAATLAIIELGFDEKKIYADSKNIKIFGVKPTPTICPYCAVGCGILVYSKDNDVIFTEGDPDHPINEGTLCSKGTTLRQVFTSDRRIEKPMYRAPGSNKWEEKDWNWMLNKIAEKIKDTRDRTFIESEGGAIVNKVESIACMGGAALDNEEDYLLSKLMRGGLGLTFIEHQARICHSSTVPGLSPSFGRGAMTNHWIDLQHTDCALIMGGNPAENHPISFRWLLKAKERGAKIISVDPRYTRTSAQADLYSPMRSGSDIAFLGGMINFILENQLFHEEYLKTYTNATFIVGDEFDFNDGIFSGYDEENRKYDKTKWQFKKDENGEIIKDPTLKNPRCVFQLLKKHYSRYDVDTVVSITGASKERFIEICEMYGATGKPEKSGTILYAMGTTQHTVGVQNVRSFAILQLILGNIGVPGGGVNAMRGESNVQGSTDFGLLFDSINGYLEVPTTDDATLSAYLKRITPKSGYKVNNPKFVVSLLKAYYGEEATKENDFGFHFLPKITAERNYSHLRLFEAMGRGELEGLFLFGQNPVVGGPNSGKEKEALGKLKWMVAVDLWETETSSFWQNEAGSDPSSIDTEVFFLPACSSFEKEGSITNSGRWMQYRWRAIKPKGKSKADLEIIHLLARRLKKLYKGNFTPVAQSISALSWNYGEGDHPEIDLVCREINGYDMKTNQLVSGFAGLADDGSTCSGNWIYCGYYPEKGKNLAKRRDNKDTGMGNYLNWSYAWPMNRRNLYNRASCDSSGKPWSQEKVSIYWDSVKSEWVGNDIPDFGKTTSPDDQNGTNAFIMLADGVAGIFSTSTNDGPFSEHYEPFESPVLNGLSSIQLNPVVQFGDQDFNPKGDSNKFPIIATTFRVSEHWQSGAMTRNQPWLSELMPHMYVEISEELAKEKGIKNREKVLVSSARGEIEAYAMITKRFKPYKLRGKNVHHVGMPWHFGYKGIAKGATANRLTPHVGDANSTIPEYKVFLCDVRRVQ
ncbi:formate dehydrogenase-N subunit alpha [Robertmurraya siralis]|uniref:Formate dehydrogenase-N subunit alpha n=1 Tax=Robertmurraya siralis TaxID=77777 RepID=A0A920BU90_9BACI|nr:formate dehydrogenase-N subunit alpha [Robertmurraya siralis]PAE20969.1 formate dehydrogenase-N subunit alpha [Bacillus sp. 7504-2]GIN62719.1 formate dehydrogenase-N subunit alpha [Robertmurraya siralis]